MNVSEEHADYYVGQIPHMPPFVVRVRTKGAETHYEYYDPKSTTWVESDMAMVYVKSDPARFRKVTTEEASAMLKTGVVA